MFPGNDSVPPNSDPTDSTDPKDETGPGGGTGAGEGVASGGHVLSSEERDEYERLRRHAGVRHRRLRKAGAAVLLVVTLLLAPLAVVTC